MRLWKRKLQVAWRRTRRSCGYGLDTARGVFAHVATIRKLRSEIALLTSYSTDTIYRLRYDTMQYDYISPSVVRLLGYSPQEMKRLNLRSLIMETRVVTDAMRQVSSFAPLEENRKRGEVHKWQADYLIRTKDGRTIWVADVSHPWYDGRGVIIGSIGSLRDITQRVEGERAAREEMNRLEHTDLLTGLANRRSFFLRLEEELKRVRRSQGDLSVLVIDVDHFRRVNEAHGQAVGDAALQGISKMITACLRETDMAARMGGEEFGVILAETSAEGAYWVAERIRTSIARQPLIAEGHGVRVPCTVSIGIAGAKFDHGMDANSLYRAADTRLYIAKHTGRNQVSMDELVGAVH